jgi:ABC-type Mn2+/Zn2+ transport system permease subunit
LVGVPRRSLLASTYASQLVTVLVAVLVGTGCGLVGAHLALRRLPIFADPEPAIALHLSAAPVTALVVAAGVGLLFTVVAILSAHWLLGRSDPARIREYAA